MSAAPRLPATAPTDSHARYTEHFFRGICICPCKQCTSHGSPTQLHVGDMRCICADCPAATCGARG
jgi:hypothetical protein